MTEHRLIQSILPEAEIESQEFQDGVIVGYHDAAHDIVLAQLRSRPLVKTDKQAQEFVGQVQLVFPGKRHPDWYAGWLAGYAVRRGIYEGTPRPENHSGGTSGGGPHNAPLHAAH